MSSSTGNEGNKYEGREQEMRELAESQKIGEALRSIDPESSDPHVISSMVRAARSMKNQRPNARTLFNLCVDRAEEIVKANVGGEEALGEEYWNSAVRGTAIQCLIRTQVAIDHNAAAYAAGRNLAGVLGAYVLGAQSEPANGPKPKQDEEGADFLTKLTTAFHEETEAIGQTTCAMYFLKAMAGAEPGDIEAAERAQREANEQTDLMMRFFEGIGEAIGLAMDRRREDVHEATAMAEVSDLLDRAGFDSEERGIIERLAEEGIPQEQIEHFNQVMRENPERIGEEIEKAMENSPLMRKVMTEIAGLPPEAIADGAEEAGFFAMSVSRETVLRISKEVKAEMPDATDEEIGQVLIRRLMDQAKLDKATRGQDPRMN